MVRFTAEEMQEAEPTTVRFTAEELGATPAPAPAPATVRFTAEELSGGMPGGTPAPQDERGFFANVWERAKALPGATVAGAKALPGKVADFGSDLIGSDLPALLDVTTSPVEQARLGTQIAREAVAAPISFARGVVGGFGGDLLDAITNTGLAGLDDAHREAAKQVIFDGIGGATSARGLGDIMRFAGNEGQEVVQAITGKQKALSQDWRSFKGPSPRCSPERRAHRSASVLSRRKPRC